MITMLSNWITKNLVEAYQLNNTEVLKILIQKIKERKGQKHKHSDISLEIFEEKTKRKIVVKG